MGVTWAAQYAVLGGGFGDYSQAVSGTIGRHYAHGSGTRASSTRITPALHDEVLV